MEIIYIIPLFKVILLACAQIIERIITLGEAPKEEEQKIDSKIAECFGIEEEYNVINI